MKKLSTKECPECKGTGKIIYSDWVEKICPECKGTGVIIVEEWSNNCRGIRRGI